MKNKVATLVDITSVDHTYYKTVVKSNRLATVIKQMVFRFYHLSAYISFCMYPPVMSNLEQLQSNLIP